MYVPISSWGTKTIWRTGEMGKDRYSDGEYWHSVSTSILGIHGGSCRILWGALSYPWPIFQTRLHTFDDNYACCRFQTSQSRRRSAWLADRRDGKGQVQRWGVLEFLPVFWGFMAAVAESFGGLCLILGLFFRPACILLTITMLVAASRHLSQGDGLRGADHAMEVGIVFLSLILIGPGKYSLDEKLSRYRRDD